MEKQTVDKRTIILYLGCGRRRHQIQIPLNSEYYDEWYEQRLRNWNVEPRDISEIEVGPRTVLELFSSAFMYGDRRVVKNPSFGNFLKYNLGCLEDHSIWKGDIRSFRLWDYDYYQKIHTVQSCTKHNQCKWNEYCLCPNGYARKEWCPKMGRFCLPMSRYLQSKPKDIDENDLVNVPCLNKKISGKNYRDFRNITREAEKCYPPNMLEGMCDLQRDQDEPGLESCNINPYLAANRQGIEGFGHKNTNLLPIILLALVMIYIYKQY
jgi:hypothetical protein